MGKFLVHHYDGNTMEYLRSGQDANENPKRPGEAMIPRNATTVAPPVVGENQKAIWKKSGMMPNDGAWGIVPDYRDITYYDKESKEEVILELGAEVTSALTTIKPEEDEVWSEELGRWDIPFDVAKAKKVDEIKYARWRAVEDGVVEYQGLHFPTDESSRSALDFTLTAFRETGRLTSAWQAKDGVLAITDVAQLRELGTLVGEHMETQFQKQFVLLTTVEGVTTKEELNGVSW